MYMCVYIYIYIHMYIYIYIYIYVSIDAQNHFRLKLTLCSTQGELFRKVTVQELHELRVIVCTRARM